MYCAVLIHFWGKYRLKQQWKKMFVCADIIVIGRIGPHSHAVIFLGCHQAWHHLLRRGTAKTLLSLPKGYAANRPSSHHGYFLGGKTFAVGQVNIEQLHFQNESLKMDGEKIFHILVTCIKKKMKETSFNIVFVWSKGSAVCWDHWYCSFHCPPSPFQSRCCWTFL